MYYRGILTTQYVRILVVSYTAWPPLSRTIMTPHFVKFAFNHHLWKYSSTHGIATRSSSLDPAANMYRHRITTP